MPSVAEAATNIGPLASALAAGVDTISQKQTVTFQLYYRLVLPLDGYVFWVKAQIVTPGAAFNAMGYSAAAALNAGIEETPLPNATLTVSGSFHYITKTNQNETESAATNMVMFTAESAVNDLDNITPNMMYIAEIEGIKYAFSERRSFYQQANLFHYAGNAVYSTLETQIVDDPISFDAENQIVSNSLPIWLSINGQTAPFPLQPTQTLPLYPSYLVPANAPLPYGAVDISQTQALQSAAVLGPTGSRSQLVSEVVKVTFYGTRNFNIMDWLDYVLQYSLFTEPLFGIQNMPVVNDLKLTQPEMLVIAQKKEITFQVNYYQSRVRDLARQLVTEAFVTITPGTFEDFVANQNQLFDEASTVINLGD